MSKFHRHAKELADLCSRHKFIVERTLETTPGIRSVFEYGHLGAEMRRNLRNMWWHDVVTSKETVNGIELSMFDVNECLPKNGNCVLNPRVVEAQQLTEKLLSLHESKPQSKESLKNALHSIISTNSMPIRTTNNISLTHIIGSQPAMPAGYAWYSRDVSITTEEHEMLR